MKLHLVFKSSKPLRSFPIFGNFKHRWIIFGNVQKSLDHLPKSSLLQSLLLSVGYKNQSRAKSCLQEGTEPAISVTTLSNMTISNMLIV